MGKVHMCDQCDYTATEKNILENHVKVKHEGFRKANSSIHPYRDLFMLQTFETFCVTILCEPELFFYVTV